MILKNVTFFIGLITLFLAYLMVIPLPNVIRTLVARNNGDTTPERNGFLSFNPFVHIDFLGIICLFLLYPFGSYTGWGKQAPLNPFSFKSKSFFSLIKVYFADSLTHIIMALLGIVALQALFDINILGLIWRVIRHPDTFYFVLNSYYPHHSSLRIVIGYIIILMIYLNVFLTVFSSLFNGFDIYRFVKSDSPFSFELQQFQTPYLLTVVLFIVFFSELLRNVVTVFIIYAGYFIGYLLRIV